MSVIIMKKIISTISIIIIGIIVTSLFLKPNASLPIPNLLTIPSPTPIPGNPGLLNTQAGKNMFSSPGVIKALDSLQNRKAFSTEDNNIRQQIISVLSDPLGGTITSTDTYTIEYWQAPDEFQSEIVGTDITTIKLNVISWFMQQGLSKDAVCHLPLVFYPNQEVKQYLLNTHQTFDPSVPGC